MPSKMSGLAELEKEIQFLGKECIVIARVEPKQWIGFTERTPANDDLGAFVRNEIESGELLKHAHRVCGAQYRNCARKTDRLGPGSGRRKNDCWRRVKKLGAVVFTHAEHVEPNLVGDLDLFKKVGHPISSRWGRTRRWIGEANDGTRVFCERLHRLHEGLSAAEADRSLRMSDVRSASKCEGNECWPHHMHRTAKGLYWEALNPPVCGGIGRPIEKLLQPECVADSEHLCTSTDVGVSMAQS